jgi:Pyruvate/2-oxoacid:ferredoxin oxidoreductase delta subunit
MLKTVLVVLGILLGIHIINTILILLIGERRPYLRSSTKNFMKEAGWKRLLNPRSFMHGYIYFRWLKQYVNFGLKFARYVPLLGPFIVDKVIRPTYHAKTITLDQASAMVTIDKEVPLQDLGEQIVPYPTARDFVIGPSTDFAVMECACRTSRKNPCQPTQVCIITGQPFVDFVLEHSPDLSRRITREEALQLIKDEHERGHVQSVWFKDASLGRIWAICNCCKCCCAGTEFMNDYDIKFMCSSGYVPAIDADLCNACYKCAGKCAFNALAETPDTVTLNWDKCMGCGVCVDVCPQSAIKLVRDERKGEPLDVRLLAENATA